MPRAMCGIASLAHESRATHSAIADAAGISTGAARLPNAFHVMREERKPEAPDSLHLGHKVGRESRNGLNATILMFLGLLRFTTLDIGSDVVPLSLAPRLTRMGTDHLQCLAVYVFPVLAVVHRRVIPACRGN